MDTKWGYLCVSLKTWPLYKDLHKIFPELSLWQDLENPSKYVGTVSNFPRLTIITLHMHMVFIS